MAYDLKLAARLRALLRSTRGVVEKEQFGGIGFMLRGNMACGVIGNDLLVRVGPEKHDQVIENKDVRPFALTGRPSRGWILVRPAGLKTSAGLRKWVRLGLDFAGSLPAK